MTVGTATLVVDLGNSSTRVCVCYGKNGKGVLRQRSTELDNHYHNIGPTAESGELTRLMENDAYNENNSVIFKMNGEYYCNGEMCRAEYNGGTIRPSASGLRKYQDIASKLALVNAFRYGYQAIEDITGGEIDSLDISWELSLLLPPEDLDGTGPKQLADMARSISEVDFILPEMKKSVNISKVRIFSEGLCALVAVVLENSQKPRKDYEYLRDPDEVTLIIDIGAGTSDFTLTQGIRVITSSRYTANIGGNNITERVDDLLRRRGIRLSDKIIARGTVSGKVKLGGKEEDVSKEVDAARSEISQTLVNETNKFLERNKYSLQSVNNLLICGGGAVDSEILGVKSLAEYLTAYIKRISEYINVIELPSVMDVEGNISKVSPRDLNIMGATILSD